MTKSQDDIIASLLEENRLLREQIADLQQRADFLAQHDTLAKGMRGETLISRMTNGQVTAYAASHDVETASGLLIEVKYSKPRKPTPRSISMRWQWNKVLGESGHKIYDFIILVGERDDRYSQQYLDRDSPFVFFCIPRSELTKVATHGKHSLIQLSTNPGAVKSTLDQALFQTYQVTQQQLALKFGL